jgi:carboxypeptidase T
VIVRRIVDSSWLLLGALFALTVAASLFSGHTPTRVAIRVAPADAALAESLALDVWSEERGPDLPLDVVITDDQLAQFPNAQILVPDIDAVARDEHERLLRAEAHRPADWFAEYHDYKAIEDHLRELVALAPGRAELRGIGASIDSRPIWALRIGNGGTHMLVNGTQHAREWISAMVSTCVADRLIRDYDRDPEIRAFVDSTELWVVPVVNPDGYQYTWSTDRYWRKNRRERHGVDLNRNFGVAWGGSGSSGSKRSDIYRGEYAFSEPETAALRDFVKSRGFAMHVDFHAYGQLILYPWGYTASPAKDRDRFAAVGDRVASAMFAEHDTRYALMQSVELYPASGTMLDWMYGDAEAQSYTIELRPKGRGGFVLPPEEIRPTCDEGLAAVLALRNAR